MRTNHRAGRHATLDTTLILVITTIAGPILGFFVGTRFPNRVYSIPFIGDIAMDIADHEHRYDTMEADGHGWRCGICGLPKKG